MYQQKRAAAIHDLSGYGHCALAVVIPVLSVMGVETVAVPTAVLSTHTGGFGMPAKRDLTHYMREAFTHYNELNIAFDYIYSGYLGSEDQISLCEAFFEENTGALLFVDPVMGDCGSAYSAITIEMQERMHRLVRQSHVMIPNVTEACILLKREYCGENITCSQAKEMLRELSKLGAQWVIITGVKFQQGVLTNLAYHQATNTFYMVESDCVPVSYPGTGDIFASTILGGMSKGMSLPEAMAYATTFLRYLVGFSYENKTETRTGVLLELCLAWLLEEQTVFDYQILP